MKSYKPAPKTPLYNLINKTTKRQDYRGKGQTRINHNPLIGGDFNRADDYGDIIATTGKP